VLIAFFGQGCYFFISLFKHTLLSSEVYRMNDANEQKTNTEIEKTASPKGQKKKHKNARTVQKKH